VTILKQHNETEPTFSKGSREYLEITLGAREV